MGRVQVKGIVISCLFLVAIAVQLFLLFTPGWYFYYEELNTEDDTIIISYDYGLQSGMAQASMANRSEIGSIDYDNRNANESVVVPTPITSMFNMVFYIVVAGIVVGLIAAVVGLLSSFRFVPGWTTMLIGLIAAGLIIAGPAYMLYTSPKAWQEGNEELEMEPLGSSGPYTDFWGEQTSDFDDEMWYYTDWGPAYAWYATLVIGTLLLILSFAFLGLKHGAEEPDYYRRRRQYDDYDRRRDPRDRDYDRRRDPRDRDYDRRPDRRDRDYDRDRRRDDRRDRDYDRDQRRRYDRVRDHRRYDRRYDDDRDRDYDFQESRYGQLGPQLPPPKEEEKKKDDRKGGDKDDDRKDRDRRDDRSDRGRGRDRY